jgi:hypothetical protein
MEIYEGNNQAVDVEKIERLRAILESEQCRPITFDEALEVGESLINFFEVLAEDALPTEGDEAAPHQLLLID